MDIGVKSMNHRLTSMLWMRKGVDGHRGEVDESSAHVDVWMRKGVDGHRQRYGSEGGRWTTYGYGPSHAPWRALQREWRQIDGCGGSNLMTNSEDLRQNGE